jgi:hypothetical protein
MPHAIRTAIFLGLVLLSRPPATARAQGPEPDLGANAALKYWQAFALLPALDKDQEKLLERWNKVPLDAAALKLIERSQGSRDSLHRGARLSRCDWSLDYDEGIFLRLPYIPKSLTLARLAALHARHEFEQGHAKAGWDDVTDLLKLARHVEVDPVMIVQMVGYVIETTAIEAAAPHLPVLKPILTEAVSVSLDALPPGPTLQQMVLLEERLGPAWLIRALEEAEHRQAGAWQDVWRSVFDAIIKSSEGQDAPDRDLVGSVKTFEQAIKMLEGLRSFYDELAKLAALPWREFDARYPEFAERAMAANPLTRFNLPNKDTFVPAQRRAQARMAMFKAAVAVVRGGPDRLRDIKDPFGDGPFEYRALGNYGFELKSKWLHQGKPVALTVGSPAKQ